MPLMFSHDNISNPFIEDMLFKQQHLKSLWPFYLFLTLPVQQDSNPPSTVNWTEAKHQQNHCFPVVWRACRALLYCAVCHIFPALFRISNIINFCARHRSCTAFSMNCIWSPGWASGPCSTDAPRCFAQRAFPRRFWSGCACRDESLCDLSLSLFKNKSIICHFTLVTTVIVCWGLPTLILYRHRWRTEAAPALLTC